MDVDGDLNWRVSVERGESLACLHAAHLICFVSTFKCDTIISRATWGIPISGPDIIFFAGKEFLR